MEKINTMSEYEANNFEFLRFYFAHELKIAHKKLDDATTTATATAAEAIDRLHRS